MTRLLGLLALNAALLAALLTPVAAPRVYPLVPPLTRVAALGDHPLDARATPPPSDLLRALHPIFRQGTTPEQRALLSRAGPAQRRIDAALGQGTALRVAVERDAAALARALGPARLAAFVAERERLSAAMGETRVWSELAGVGP